MDLFRVVLAIVLYSTVEGACPDTTWEYTGAGAYTTYSSVNTDTGTAYLMESVDYHVPEACTCGVVKTWHFYAKAAGAIQLQVWEQSAVNLYVLKGENYITVPASGVDNEIQFEVPIKDRITVRNGYLIGWYGATSGIIGYTEGDDTYPDEQKKRVISDLAVGASMDWSDGNAQVFEKRVYAIGATVTDSTAPGFTNLPRTVFIYRTAISGMFLYKPEVDDIDENDVATLIISTPEDADGNYYYNQTTGETRLGITPPAVGTSTLTFTVTDQCGKSATGVLTITVLNWAPSITSLPAFAIVPETLTIQTHLGVISFSDADDATLTFNTGPAYDPSNPNNIEYKFQGQDNANRSVVSKTGATWSYSTAQQYIISMILQDANSAVTQTGYFLVYVTKNDPPKFTTLNNTANANVSYPTAAAGDLVHAVGVSDAEDDTLTFTMTCSEATCPFTMRGNIEGLLQNYYGSIYVSEQLLRAHYIPGYDLQINVNDGFTTIDRKTLTVLVQDINDVPVITSLPLQRGLLVYENTALDTSLFTVRYNDVDTGDNHTIQALYTPSWAVNYFEMNITTGILTTAHNVINYEDVPATTVTLNVTVNDGLDYDIKELVITIANVNEAPTFHQTAYRLEPPEEGALGASAGSPNFQLNEPDNPDTQTYSWDCGTNNRYFYMDTSGAITYAALFDYDTSTVAVPYNCSVTVTDSGGLTATTILEIDVQDVNDNNPVFSQSTDYIFVQPHDLAVSRFVGQVTATDADRTPDIGTIYYSFQTSPFSKSYLYINQFGNIYVNESWEKPLFDLGVSYELVVLAENAVDRTGTRRTATATVTLMLPGTSTVLPITTDRPYKFESDPRNVAWLTAAAVFFLVLLVIACGFIVIYTTQVKRYRWCIPWCRKRMLGLNKYVRRQKRKRYLDMLKREALMKQAEEESSSSDYDSDEEYWAQFGQAPSMTLWSDRDTGTSQVPTAARYDQPKPPLKRALSRMLLQKGGPKLFDQ